MLIIISTQICMWRKLLLKMSYTRHWNMLRTVSRKLKIYVHWKYKLFSCIIGLAWFESWFLYIYSRTVGDQQQPAVRRTTDCRTMWTPSGLRHPSIPPFSIHRSAGFQWRSNSSVLLTPSAPQTDVHTLAHTHSAHRCTPIPAQRLDRSPPAKRRSSEGITASRTFSHSFWRASLDREVQTSPNMFKRRTEFHDVCWNVQNASLEMN